MSSQLRPALVVLVCLTVVTGVVYPALITVIAGAAFPHQATGSLISVGAQVFGSELIGQPFRDSEYFSGRPSATQLFPYNSASSSGSNLGPTNPALLEQVEARLDAFRAADPGNTALVPVDLVTASASGLDPDISVAAALYQAPRVARARGLDVERVIALVRQHTRGRQLGLLGEPRVNVLELNLALDSGR